MAKLNFELLKSKKQLKEIANWEYEFEDTPELKLMLRFILHGNYLNLNHFLKTREKELDNQEDTFKQFWLIKDDTDEIVAFVEISVFKKADKNILSITYIAVRPDMQHKNIGSEILERLPQIVEENLNIKINSTMTFIESTNKISARLFKKLGYDLSNSFDENFYVASKANIPPKTYE